jgi:hypothetical protein
MARVAGRRGRLYAGIASDTAAAEPIAFLNTWSLDQSVDNIDVTSFGDTTKTYVAGMPDATGSFGWFYDTATAQDGLARRFYLYPDITDGDYFFGTALFDFSVTAATDGAVTVSGNWAAASSIQKAGTA